MTKSKVYFTDMRCAIGDSLIDKTRRVVDAAGFDSMELDGKFVAIKVHFGELGNLSYLRPNYARLIADLVKRKGGKPYLTDCNTLYVGKRRNALDHMDTANLNGFNQMSTGCQIIIGDGLRGTDDVEISVENGKYIQSAKIGRAIADSDVLITLNHFKCHELTGMGGAIKNLAMGCASRRGKMEMHSAGKPEVDTDGCRGCGKCIGNCAQDAITIVERKALLDHDKCVGCGRCIAACPYDAVHVAMDEDKNILNSKMVEYASAVLRDRPTFHVTVICDVSPYCDCHGENDAPVIPDVGILASFDPVALDKACVDLVQQQPVLPGSRLHDNCKGCRPDDLLACNHPNTRWESHFEHAMELGFGSSDYELINVR